MEPVTFKGNRAGIAMILDSEMDFEALCQVIVQKLWQARDFLGEHTNIIVNSGERVLDDGQRLALRVLLQSLGHTVNGFTSTGQAAASAAAGEPEETIELPHTMTEQVGGSLSQNIEGLETYYADGSTLIIRKNIRSGQSISFDGTLIVFGDVNAGAELSATGHIMVMGKLRGIAHAGSGNNQEAIVYANRLQPVQLRIAELIARAPDDEVMEPSQPEIARIIDNRLVIETCLVS